MKKRKRKRKKVFFRTLKISLLIIFLIMCLFFLLDRYLPNFEQISLEQAFPQWEDSIGIAVEDIAVESNKKALIKNSEVYFTADFVKEYIDKYIFWEENSDRLTITTEDKVIKMKTDELTAYVNNDILTLNLPIEKHSSEAYLPESLLEMLYNVDINYIKNYDIITLDYTEKEYTKAEIISKKEINLRQKADKKSYIISKIQPNEEVYIYDYRIENEWTRIRFNGIVGYIETKYISNIYKIEPVVEEVKNEKEIWKPENGKINLVWEQVFKVESNMENLTLKAKDGLDVVSPTWFSIADENGNISNIADKRYVDWAHNQGYQVWALIDNQFDGKLTHSVLSNSESRENLIKQILALAALYDLDGINVDFESVKQETGDYYLQFLRELAPFMKEQGLIITVDTYVPSNWSWYYHRDEVAKVVDYVMVMTYDEHWSTSPESGSVASLSWVRESIEASLELIPKEKLLMGVPYYTRLWAETLTEEGVKVSSVAYGMEKGKNILKEHNVEPIWNEKAGQYYGEYTEDGITYKIWLEEERSITEKVKLAQEYDLAGIAGWKRGLESVKIWDILKQELKN